MSALANAFTRTFNLPLEEQAAYESLGAHFMDRWNPQTDAERELVLTIQNTTWRLDRVIELESSLFAIGTAEHLESISERFPDLELSARGALARSAGYLANARAFRQLNCQEGRLQRALDRAKRDIVSLIYHRTSTPDPVVSPAAPPTSRPETTPAAAAPAPATGFVSTKTPSNMPVFVGKKAKQHRRLWLNKNAQQNVA